MCESQCELLKVLRIKSPNTAQTTPVNAPAMILPDISAANAEGNAI